jgi:hypothetical protein
MRVVIAAVLYFAGVFACGFVLGAIRTLWIEPLIGARTAQLCELPLMALVSLFAARLIATRLRVPTRAGSRLAMGGLALLLVLVLEFGVVLRLRGLGLEDYFANLDPVAGSAYWATLLLFTLAPWLRSSRAPS